MNTEKIIWEEQFSIGNASIDHDHKKIIEIFNGIVDLLSQEINRDECARYLTEMTNYSLSHFKKEEKYMQQFSYPKFNEHKHFHMEYIYNVSMFNLTFFNSDHPEPQKVLKFLHDWWIHHIQNIDREYEIYRQQLNLDVSYETSGPHMTF